MGMGVASDCPAVASKGAADRYKIGRLKIVQLWARRHLGELIRVNSPLNCVYFRQFVAIVEMSTKARLASAEFMLAAPESMFHLETSQSGALKVNIPTRLEKGVFCFT